MLISNPGGQVEGGGTAGTEKSARCYILLHQHTTACYSNLDYILLFIMYYTFFYNPPPLPAAFIFLYYSKFDFIKAAKNKKCLANFLEFKLDLLILNLGGADGHTI